MSFHNLGSYIWGRLLELWLLGQREKAQAVLLDITKPSSIANGPFWIPICNAGEWRLPQSLASRVLSNIWSFAYLEDKKWYILNWKFSCYEQRRTYYHLFYLLFFFCEVPVHIACPFFYQVIEVFLLRTSLILEGISCLPVIKLAIISLTFSFVFGFYLGCLYSAMEPNVLISFITYGFYLS